MADINSINKWYTLFLSTLKLVTKDCMTRSIAFGEIEALRKFMFLRVERK